MVHQEGRISTVLLKKLLSAASAPVLLLLIIISQYVFNLDFTCPCSSSGWSTVYTALYLVFPSLTILVVAFLTDRQLKKGVGFCSITCSCRCSLECFCHRFWRPFLKVLTIALLWIIIALLDGDWFICVKNTDIFCKKNRTEEESVVFQFRKSESQFYGFICIFGVSLLWLLSSCPCSKTPFYKRKYEKCLEKTTHQHVKEQLQDMAKARAHSICKEPFRSIREDEKLPQHQNQQQDQLQQQLFLQIQLLVQQQHQWLVGQAPRGQEEPAEQKTGEGKPEEDPEAWDKISHPTFHLKLPPLTTGGPETGGATGGPETGGATGGPETGGAQVQQSH